MKRQAGRECIGYVSYWISSKKVKVYQQEQMIFRIDTEGFLMTMKMMINHLQNVTEKENEVWRKN